MNGNLLQYNAASGDDTFLEFDAQNNVRKITVGTSAATTTPTARDEFWYTPDGERFLGRESWYVGGSLKSAITTYLGSYEEVRPAAGGTYKLIQRTQVSGAVQYVRRTDHSNAVTSLWRYLHRDPMGSVDAVATSSGAAVFKQSFDAFGGPREATWASDLTSASRTTLLGLEDENGPRGFTDHEMLNRTGFVHMNGRVFDARIGQFVSPDPIVADPAFSQSYNRYSYVFNQPTRFTDPSGFRPNLGPGATVIYYVGDNKNGPSCDEIVAAELCSENWREWYETIQEPINDVIREFTTREATRAATGHIEAAIASLGDVDVAGASVSRTNAQPMCLSPEACHYSLGLLHAGMSIQDTADIVWREVEITATVASIAYGGAAVHGLRASAGLAARGGLTAAERATADLASKLRFTETAGRHMGEAGRFVPRHTLAGAIQGGTRMADPQGVPGAIKIVQEISVNGGSKTLEIIYREADNTIMHFLYR